MGSYDDMFKRLNSIEGMIADSLNFSGLKMAIMTKSYRYDVQLDKFKQILQKANLEWDQANFNARDRVYTFPTTKSSIRFFFPDAYNTRGMRWDAVYFDGAAHLPIEIMEYVVSRMVQAKPRKQV